MRIVVAAATGLSLWFMPGVVRAQSLQDFGRALIAPQPDQRRPDPRLEQDRRDAYEQGRRDAEDRARAERRNEDPRYGRRRENERQDGLRQDGRYNHDDRRGNDDDGYRPPYPR